MSAPRPTAEAVPDSFRTALGWFAAIRVLVALALAVLALPEGARPLGLTLSDPPLFRAVSFAYLLLAIAYLAAARRLALPFRAQLVLHVTTDLVALAVLMSAGGDARGSLGALMISSIAAAAVVSGRRMAVSFAAGATLLLLAEAAWRALAPGQGSAVVVNAGVTGAACFVTALLVDWLATRLHAQEDLARRRGEDLREQLAVTRRVVSELQQGVLVVAPDGAVRAINAAAGRMLGVAAPAPPLSAGEGATAAWRALADACARWRASGATPRAEATIDAAPDPRAGGRAVRLRVHFLGAEPAGRGDAVLMIEDQSELEERAQQLKLASMGRLSASIAHEIRNPLAAIRHANGLLAERLDDPQLRRLAGIVEDNTVRIDRIVADVLSIARRERAAVESIDLRQFLEQLLSEFAAQTGADLRRIAVRLDSAEPMRFDSNHLRQVLSNLLGNALRYASQQPGAVLVHWRAREGDRLELRVADDGPGLSPEMLQHAFEPFFTTESRGTGLGLYLARELCAANGAAIRYQAGGDPAPYRGAFVIEPGRD